MTLSVRFIDAARLDVVAAWGWYESQRSGLGDRFVAAVDAAVNRLQRWPSSGAPVAWSDDGGILERKVAIKGFSWTIRYRDIDGQIVVMAVHHQRRHPDHPDGRTA